MDRPDGRTPQRQFAVQLPVQLARVARGQPRLLQSTNVSTSAAHPAVVAPFRKLIVRVRFSSPAPHTKARARTMIPDRALIISGSR